MLHTDTLVVFEATGKSVIFPAEFFVFDVCDCLTRAQKAMKKLRREKGAEEIRRAFRKPKEHWNLKDKGTAPFCFKI